jgi:hypothetical protein
MPCFLHLTPVFRGGVFPAKRTAVNASLCAESYVSSTSNPCQVSFAYRAVQRENEEEKNSLWFDKFIFGQAIFIGVTKSITLTSDGAIA